MNKEKKCTPCERARLARIAARKAQQEKIQKQQNDAIKLKNTNKKTSTLNIKKDEKTTKDIDLIPCEECDQVKD